MADDWIEFNDPPPFLSDGMYVSLDTHSMLYLNKKVYEAMDGPKAFQLFYSPSTNRIGLRAAEVLNSNAYELKPKGGYGGQRVLIMPFCRKHEIKYSDNVQFLEVKIEDRMLKLNLQKTRPVKKPRKNKTRRG